MESNNILLKDYNELGDFKTFAKFELDLESYVRNSDFRKAAEVYLCKQGKAVDLLTELN